MGYNCKLECHLKVVRIILFYTKGTETLVYLFFRFECAEKNFTWINSKITFDHVGHAYLALFQVVSVQTKITIRVE